MYSVALTNTASSFIVHQLHMPEPPRAILSLVLVLGLIAILNFGQDITVKVMSMLVYPFIVFSTVYRNIFNSTVEYVNA